MAEEERGGVLMARLSSVDRALAGLALDDEAFAALDLQGLHHAHGVAGRVQDRVTSILTRLTMEMVSREDVDVPGGDARPRG